MERLLLLAYRLSAVVSPVIQSSSPEGLIPMDTDSGQLPRANAILSPSLSRYSFGEIQKLNSEKNLFHAMSNFFSNIFNY